MNEFQIIFAFGVLIFGLFFGITLKYYIYGQLKLFDSVLLSIITPFLILYFTPKAIYSFITKGKKSIFKKINMIILGIIASIQAFPIIIGILGRAVFKYSKTHDQIFTLQIFNIFEENLFNSKLGEKIIPSK